MGKLTVIIPDEIEKEFRELVPARKGALSSAVAAAISIYVEQRRKKKK